MSSYSQHTDSELVRALISTDTTNASLAFTELYNRYWKKLLAVAFHKLNDSVEAEEAVQDVFVNLWNRKDRLEIRYTFHTYMASSVKYEILSRMAKQKKKSEFEQQTLHIASHNNSHNNVEEWMDYEATRKRIEDTVQGLPEKCQLTFRLSREQGLSEKEIAAELNIAPKTVEAHMTKALKKLRSSLQQFFASLF